MNDEDFDYIRVDRGLAARKAAQRVAVVNTIVCQDCGRTIEKDSNYWVQQFKKDTCMDYCVKVCTYCADKKTKLIYWER